ncbi:trypsin-like peptidase domain-containing protein [Magnetofaba australis]|uniref:Putative Peptidase S1 and S6 chymotrypsin/Hap n=1 Tax=Magnetofaba australis IT-1 TaxID=1434232 RepID=A0A1Y2K1W8_9PROT|nr:trypsin-like peptidase domain-containing protein [Magnetofaba australis]OSM00192.1 putative Peptidase S1 and S6 chymotrypsin/Hap [Magnetofaba australis IT-1]
MVAVKWLSLRRLAAPVALAATLALGGCASGGGSSGAGPSAGEAKGSEYTLFFSPTDHVEKLMNQGKKRKAAQVYVDQRAYFENPENRAKSAPVLKKLADALHQDFKPSIQKALTSLETVNWPEPRTAWSGLRENLAAAKLVMARMERIGLLQEPQYAIETAQTLQARVQELEGAIKADMTAEFLDYPEGADDGFFEVYPIQMDAAEFFEQHSAELLGKLRNAPSKMIVRLAKSQADDMPDSMRQRLADTLMQTLEREHRGRNDLAATLDRLAKLSQAGLPAGESKLKVLFADVTSRTLMQKGQLEFSVGITPDLPFEVSAGGAADAFNAIQNRSADVVVMLDIAYARMRREIVNEESENSEYVSGYQTVENPAYLAMQDQVSNLQMEVTGNQMQTAAHGSTYCFGNVGCAIGNLIGSVASHSRLSSSKQALNAVRQRMRRMKRTIREPLYDIYSYKTLDVEVVKTVTANLHVIDLTGNRYFTDTFDIVKKTQFNVPYGLKSTDRKFEQIMNAASNEKEVKDFEQKPLNVKLSEILQFYVESPAQTKPLPSLASLQKKLQKERNQAVAAWKSQRIEADFGNDRRMEHVVKVINGVKSAFGSGFYIDSDLIMTNYHVVEDAEYVEVRNQEDRESFGKVLARDPILDLAIIKVDLRGRPVRFYGSGKVPIGADVAVMGNPKGYDFSVTRGVISAVRREQGPAADHMGKAPMYIQTDAAINGGNSGGPMFLGDRVIGINTWKNIEKHVSGLNFSLHFREAEAFIRRKIGHVAAMGASSDGRIREAGETPDQMRKRRLASAQSQGLIDEPAVGGKHAVYIGAYDSPTELAAMLIKASGAGVATFTKSINQDGASLTQLYAGPFPSNGAARSALGKLRKQGVPAQLRRVN